MAWVQKGSKKEGPGQWKSSTFGWLDIQQNQQYSTPQQQQQQQQQQNWNYGYENNSGGGYGYDPNYSFPPNYQYNQQHQHHQNQNDAIKITWGDQQSGSNDGHEAKSHRSTMFNNRRYSGSHRSLIEPVVDNYLNAKAVKLVQDLAIPNKHECVFIEDSGCDQCIINIKAFLVYTLTGIFYDVGGTLAGMETQ